MPLDFKRGTDLFMGTEEELARALGVDRAELSRHRADPGAAPASLVHDLADVLEERGRAMVRVAEMLHEAAGEADPRDNGRGV